MKKLKTYQKLIKFCFFRIPVMALLSFGLALGASISRFFTEIRAAFSSAWHTWKHHTIYECRWCETWRYLHGSYAPGNNCEYCHGNWKMGTWRYLKAYKKWIKNQEQKIDDE